MRHARSLRRGYTWAAVVALVAAPLVTAPLVSAATPSGESTPAASSSDAATEAALAAATLPDESAAEDPTPAAQQEEATQSATTASVEPAATPSEEPTVEPTPSAEPTVEPTQAVTAAQAKAAAAAAPAAKPTKTSTAPTTTAPTTTAAGNANLVVKATGSRTGKGGADVTAVEGVTLALYSATKSNGQDSWSSASWDSADVSCVTGSGGTCTLVVPSSLIGKSNVLLRVSATAAPSGWAVLTSVALDSWTNDVTPPASTPYGQLLKSSSLTVGTSYTLAQSTGRGTIAVRKDNPSKLSSCGIRVGLLMDVSGSIGDGDTRTAMREAGKGMVDALVGTPSQLGVWSFAQTTSAVTTSGDAFAMKSVKTADEAAPIKTAIGNLTTGGGTNWDDGLYTVATAGANLDALIVVTDGQPTWSNETTGGNDGGGSSTSQIELERAVWSANKLKAGGTQVYAIGVGNGITDTDNLAAISSPGSYATSTDYTALKTQLQTLAAGACKGTVSVFKYLTDAAGNTTNATALSGVTFTGSPTVEGSQVTDANGGANFQVNLGSSSSATVTLTETVTGGRSIVQQSGKNATCKLNSDGTQTNLTVTNDGTSGFKVAVGVNQSVACYVYNKPAPVTATVKVVHQWVDQNGNPITDLDGAIATDSTVSALTSQTSPTYDTTYSNYTVGSTVSYAGSMPTVTSGRDCKVVEVDANNAAVTGPKTWTATLEQASTTFTVYHRLTCTTQVTLKKTVEGGTATASDFKPSIGGGSATWGTAKTVTAGTIAIAETDNRTSTQQKAERYDLTKLVCDTDSNASVSNQKVAVHLGQSPTCTFTNQLVKLDVTKRAFKGTDIPDNRVTGEISTGQLLAPQAVSFLFTTTNNGKAAITLGSVTDPQLAGKTVSCTTASTGGTWTNFSNLTTGQKTLQPGTSLYCKVTNVQLGAGS